MSAHLKVIPAIVVLLFSTFAFAAPQDVAVVKSTWTPPAARTSKTIFAPKPLGGDNIFKGEAEVWLANSIEEFEGGNWVKRLDDAAIAEYVTKVGNYVATHSVAPAKHYEFIVTQVLESDAMTAGGGRIYISRGMLEETQNEDELAGILAHEIAHDAFAHAGKAVTRQMFWLTGTRKVKTSADVRDAMNKLLTELEKKPLATITEIVLGFSRFDELEADRAAFYNTYKAGYNPRGMMGPLTRLAARDKKMMGDDYLAGQLLTLLFGSHPPTEQRSLAFSWESNFVKAPKKDSHHTSPAFDEMKSHLAALSKKS
ncbi:MAG TPA: M48 family metalloprotease [Pyrinomonadaceae bacterium]|nr:M48 family metalloprotease [Pyrinomonadaceae bacterium]